MPQGKRRQRIQTRVFPIMFKFLQHKYPILVCVFSTRLKLPSKASEAKKKSPQFYIRPRVQLWSLGVWENASGLARVETNTLRRDTLIAEKPRLRVRQTRMAMDVVTSVRILLSRHTEETPEWRSSSRKSCCFTRYQSFAGYQPRNCWRTRPKTIPCLCSTIRARRVSKHVFKHM